MKGRCLTKCGYDIEYESHEFSDGFVYYLPLNSDKTVHDCFMVSQILVEAETALDDEDSWKKIFQENIDRLKIGQDEFLEIMANVTPFEYLGDMPYDFGLMCWVREGKMFELKKALESQLNLFSAPFFGHRSTISNLPGILFEDGITANFTNASDDDVSEMISIDLPTNNGYQLEYLGKFYELMLRLEDAKKCYQLQYRSTKEPELKKIMDELDEKIKVNEKIKQEIPVVIDSYILKKTFETTQEKIGQYIVALFSNDMNSIWKRLPWLGKQIKGIHEKEQESIIPPITEKNDLERLSLGQLVAILKESKSKMKSKSDGKCKICGKTWKKGDNVFVAKYSKENDEKITCSDERCFKNQGGLIADVSHSLINRCYLITEARNLNAHPRDYDEKKLQNIFKEAFESCKVINDHIDGYLENKNFI